LTYEDDGSVFVINDKESKCRYWKNKFTIGDYASELATLPFEEIKARKFVTRSSCWLVDAPCNCIYAYGGKKFEPIASPKWLTELKCKVAAIIKANPIHLNSCNANMYKTHKQDLYWHKDNEPLFRESEFNRDTYIVSLSFGANRIFCFRKPYEFDEIPVNLGDGDIITMEGRLQDRYEHTLKRGDAPSVSPNSGASESSQVRYNLTWRILKKHLKSCPCSMGNI
jgi:alkylated DNA repair dioxygenase AlkB